jgi:hypothetical protein
MRTWIGLVVFVVACVPLLLFLFARRDGTPVSPAPCPSESTLVGDACVATKGFDSGDASLAPAVTSWNDLAPADAGESGIRFRGCSSGMFTLIRPGGVPPLDPDAHADLTRAIRAKDPAVRPCPGARDVWVALPSGPYSIIVGWGETPPPSYGPNKTFPYAAFRRDVEVGGRQPWAEVVINGYAFGGDTHCPFAEFVDSETGASGRARVLLDRRASRALAGTDRVVFAEVPVHRGRVLLRVFDVDDEVAYFDRLAVEQAGNTLREDEPGSLHALGAVDGAMLAIPRGREITLPYSVEGVREGTIDVVVIATGFYESPAR